MEDYKEMIDILRNGQPHVILDYSEDFANAIETLMKERDVAFRDIKRNCGTCKYKDIGMNDEPCNNCVHCGGHDKNWEWMGV